MRTVIFAVAGLLLVTAPARSAGRITSFDDRGEPARAVDIRLTAFGSFTIPCGEFGQASNGRSGFALAGSGGGLELSGRYRHDVEVGAAVWVDQNRGDGNRVASYIERAIEAAGFPVPPGGYHVSMTRWNSVWGLMRVGYDPRVGRVMRAFGAGYVGAVYARSPGVVITVSSPGISSRTAGHAYFGPAVGAGAGVRLGEHFTLEMLYLQGSLYPQGWSGRTDGEHQPIGELQAAMGYGFGF